MTHNVGKIDRMIRLILAALLATLYFTHLLEGSWAVVASGAAIVLFVTSLRSCCPIYPILGFGTCQVKSSDEEAIIKTKPLKR
ncbi:MAG: DUF2892 domain-containing protein [Bacteroidales bacterium]|nr:DUF2892 domain-containing protein [Bacteroidales bacterium]